jgi:hypothetical protein
MRQNAFGESILQPNDTYQDLEKAWEEKFGELPEVGRFNVEIYSHHDETYKIGGEFRDNDSGEGVAFDGFSSVDGARAWLENNLDIPSEDIEVLEDDE